MLKAYLSFAGPTGQILNYMGNEKAIEAPTIVRTGAGRYIITFITARQIDAVKIGSSIVKVQCQSPAGSGTVTNVIPSPAAVFNPNASQFRWSISFQVETQNVVPSLLILGQVLSYIDRQVIMISFIAKNTSFAAPAYSYGYAAADAYAAPVAPAYAAAPVAYAAPAAVAPTAPVTYAAPVAPAIAPAYAAAPVAYAAAPVAYGYSESD